MPPDAPSQTRERLLDATEELMLAGGYASTAVDEICERAGVTKGAFFHYFESKHQIALEAVRRFYARQTQMFRAAPYRQLHDPLDRLYGYLDFLGELARHPAAMRGCLVGTLAQELAASDETMRTTCEACFAAAAEDLRRDLAAAKASRCPRARWSADSLAEHCLAVLQGSLILAKSAKDPRVLAENLGHLRRYLVTLYEGQS